MAILSEPLRRRLEPVLLTSFMAGPSSFNILQTFDKVSNTRVLLIQGSIPSENVPGCSTSSLLGLLAAAPLRCRETRQRPLCPHSLLTSEKGQLSLCLKLFHQHILCLTPPPNVLEQEENDGGMVPESGGSPRSPTALRKLEGMLWGLSLSFLTLSTSSFPEHLSRGQENSLCLTTRA